jgi:hypothetical protein
MQSAETTAEPVEGVQSCPDGVRDNRLSGGRTVGIFVRASKFWSLTVRRRSRAYVLLVMELPASALPLLLAALLAVLLPLVLRLLSGSSKRRAPTTLQPTAQVRASTVKEAYTGSARLLWPAPSTVFDPAPHRHETRFQVELKLVHRENVSHDTRLFRFALPVRRSTSSWSRTVFLTDSTRYVCWFLADGKARAGSANRTARDDIMQRCQGRGDSAAIHARQV